MYVQYLVYYRKKAYLKKSVHCTSLLNYPRKVGKEILKLTWVAVRALFLGKVSCLSWAWIISAYLLFTKVTGSILTIISLVSSKKPSVLPTWKKDGRFLCLPDRVCSRSGGWISASGSQSLSSELLPSSPAPYTKINMLFLNKPTEAYLANHRGGTRPKCYVYWIGSELVTKADNVELFWSWLPFPSWF